MVWYMIINLGSYMAWRKSFSSLKLSGMWASGIPSYTSISGGDGIANMSLNTEECFARMNLWTRKKTNPPSASSAESTTEPSSKYRSLSRVSFGLDRFSDGCPSKSTPVECGFSIGYHSSVSDLLPEYDASESTYLKHWPWSTVTTVDINQCDYLKSWMMSDLHIKNDWDVSPRRVGQIKIWWELSWRGRAGYSPS